MDRQNEAKFRIHIIIVKVYIGIVMHHFSQICNKSHGLDLRQNLVFAQYLENELRQNETKFCMHIIIDKIYIGIVNRRFLQICNTA